MEIGISEKIDDNFFISENYEKSLDIDIKKNRGIYYTPKVIVDYILEKTLKAHDIVKNPYLKILDISCGCGNFLLEAYDILYNMFEENIYELKKTYGEKYWRYDNIHTHIISNCIYGVDTDKDAVEILKNSLLQKNEDIEVEKLNIYCSDSLKKSWDFKFDYIVGNPPYLGHKRLDIEYKKYLLENYSEVYKDKSDIYFCFYKKIIESLNEKGISSVITPRYFLESPSGKYLRNYLRYNIKIDEIIDFLGSNIFKNIGVSSCIVTLKKEKTNDNINIFKIKDDNRDVCKNYSIKELISRQKFESFKIEQGNLDINWMLLNNEDKEFHNKIESKCDYILEDITESFQGIITGCDKAFIVKNDDERLKNIDDYILKNWVKNKNIDKYIVNASKYKLIYANDIDEEEDSVALKECVGVYKERLENRRECRKNIRKWYELQWGRKKSLFEREKIMYPYKAKENRFAIDHDNNFSSADVYSFFIKEKYKEEFSHEYLVAILNSSTYDKYFKMTAKKMSKNIFDYYPNKVMKMKIFKDENYEEIERLSKQIINILSKQDNQIEKVEMIKQRIDELVRTSLGV